MTIELPEDVPVRMPYADEPDEQTPQQRRFYRLRARTSTRPRCRSRSA